jgi:hypothetical protein
VEALRLVHARRVSHVRSRVVQLYEALRRDQLGELDREAFWNAIFRAAGEVNLPEPEREPGGEPNA